MPTNKNYGETSMAYDVSFTIPERVLGKADVEFTVKRNGGAWGTLKVSKRSVVWVPSRKQSGIKVRWRDFDALMHDFDALMQEHEKSKGS